MRLPTETKKALAHQFQILSDAYFEIAHLYKEGGDIISPMDNLSKAEHYKYKTQFFLKDAQNDLR